MQDESHSKQYTDLMLLKITLSKGNREIPLAASLKRMKNIRNVGIHLSGILGELRSLCEFWFHFHATRGLYEVWLYSGNLCSVLDIINKQSNDV